MKKVSVESVTATRPLFQMGEGGSIPTSTHQLWLELISNRQANTVYAQYHYLADTPFISSISFGVFFGGELHGALSWGPPAGKVMKGLYDEVTQRSWWELKRLALSDLCPKNSESRVIALCIKLIRKQYNVAGILTYADDSVGHKGTIYKACGFEYRGLVAEKSDFYDFDEKKIIQRGTVAERNGEWRPRTRKHLFVKNFK